MDALILETVGPAIILLILGVVAAVASRALRTSPIVGYLVLGLALRAFNAWDMKLIVNSGVVGVLAELGVVFLLFDIGLHFSLNRIQQQARDIFGFGPVQILLGTIGLALAALAFGLSPLAAVVLGAILSLSSTAVVARLVAERHQQNCPVGLTATAILIFQDVAAILLLIVANSFDGADLVPAVATAIVKAVLAFAVAVAIAKLAVRPIFDLVARSGAEEVFTAMALFIALAAGWATGQIGLSLTLGAFLGGVTIAETPYRAVIAAEIKPFRGLLLGFFFISVGASLDLHVLIAEWPAVIAITAGFLVVKILTNMLASLVFRWSVPGSIQLGFLLAQGSEFAFVVLSLPAVRALIGQAQSSIVIAAVAASLAVTPSLAAAGRELAGKLRRRKMKPNDPELVPLKTAPVLIVGMGRRGRAVADALSYFGINYSAVERDQRRLSEAVADGYKALYADMADPRIWEPVAAEQRRLSILTSPTFEESNELTHFAQSTHPSLKRIAAVTSSADAERYRGIGIHPIIDADDSPGTELATYVLDELGVDKTAVSAWIDRQRALALGSVGETLSAA